ncbi:hypothetical protein pb186bvf_007056 [Paramecium bursaria]
MLNKSTLSAKKDDQSVRYLQTIHEKEEQVKQIQKENDHLRQEIFNLKNSRESQQLQNDLKRLKKLEKTNLELKKMLNESQDFILQTQEQQLMFSDIQMMMNQILKNFNLNPNMTIQQQIQFIQKQMINTELLNEFKDILEFIQQIQPLNIEIGIQLSQIMGKYYQDRFYHPLSTKALLDQILTQLMRIFNIRNIYNGVNGVKFKQQLEQVSLICSAIEVKTVDEERMMMENEELQEKVQQLQASLIECESQIRQYNDDIDNLNYKLSQLNEANCQLQNKIQQQSNTIQALQQEADSYKTELVDKQQFILSLEHLQSQNNEKSLKLSEREPFVQVLSARDLESSLQSGSSQENQEIQDLKLIIEQKEHYIKQEEQLKQKLLNQVWMLENSDKIVRQQQELQGMQREKQWDLQVLCPQGQIKSIVRNFWQFHFSSEQGLDEYNQFISIFGIKSEGIMKLVDKLTSQSILKLDQDNYQYQLNKNIVYLKQNNEQNCTVQLQVKLIDFQLFQSIFQVNKGFESELALDELWVDFSFINGPLLFIIHEYSEKEIQLIYKICRIQEISQTNPFIIIYEKDDKVFLDQLIDQYSFKNLNEDEKGYGRLLINIQDLKIQEFYQQSKSLSYVTQLRQYLQNKLKDFLSYDGQPEFNLIEAGKLQYNLKMVVENPKVRQKRMTNCYLQACDNPTLEIQEKVIIISIQSIKSCQEVKTKFNNIVDGSFLFIKLIHQDNTISRYQAQIPNIQIEHEPQTIIEDQVIIIKIDI